MEVDESDGGDHVAGGFWMEVGMPPPQAGVDAKRFLGGEFIILLICETYSIVFLLVGPSMSVRRPDLELLALPNQIPSTSSVKTFVSLPSTIT